MISADLLKILACPVCKAPLVENAAELICQQAKCGLAFPIREGIPVLLAEEARTPSKRV